MRRILSSQANGARSTGPRTPAGIARSSGNSLRHGLLAKYTVLSNESPSHFAQLLDQYALRLNPADDVEFGIVEEMVSSCWRLRRLWAIESRTLQNALADTPDTDELGRITVAFSRLASTPKLDLIQRYETRLHRIFHRALRNLLLIRETMPNEPSPTSEQSAPITDETQTPPVCYTSS